MSKGYLDEIDHHLTSAKLKLSAYRNSLNGEALPKSTVKRRAIPKKRGAIHCTPDELPQRLSQLKPGQNLVVSPGVYYGTLNIKNAAAASIVAETPGTVRISGLWKGADLGKTKWVKEQGVWSAPHADSFMGAAQGCFLFRYKTVADLKAARVAGVTKPAYGYAYQGKKIYLQMPAKGDPNGKSVKLADKKSQNIVKITNSPGLRIDGFCFEGSGDADAILFDAKSINPVLRNCVFEYCRRAARLPHGSLVEWCEYTYPGFKKFFDQLFDLNKGKGEVIFDLVKKYWAAKGNAAIEGGFAESVYPGGSEGCEFRFNYYHQLFDCSRLGAFKGKKGKKGKLRRTESHHNVFQYAYDNFVEFENWSAKRPTTGLHLHHCLLLDCIAGPLSHQDSTNNGMKGDHLVSHNILRSTAPKRYHPPYLIKLLNLQNVKKPIVYEFNYLEQAPGHNDGYGDANSLAKGLRGQKVDSSKIIVRKNIIARVTTKADGEPNYAKDNVVIKTPIRDLAKLSEIIGETVDENWPRPRKRAFSE